MAKRVTALPKRRNTDDRRSGGWDTMRKEVNKGRRRSSTTATRTLAHSLPH